MAPHPKRLQRSGSVQGWMSSAKRLQLLFLVGRGRPGSGGRCSALRSGSSSLFPFVPPRSRPSPRKCSSGAAGRRDFEGLPPRCRLLSIPEPRALRSGSAPAMRLLGTAAALGRGLPRVPAALGWQGRQVECPGSGAEPGLSPGRVALGAARAPLPVRAGRGARPGAGVGGRWPAVPGPGARGSQASLGLLWRRPAPGFPLVLPAASKLCFPLPTNDRSALG